MMVGIQLVFDILNILKLLLNIRYLQNSMENKLEKSTYY